MLRFTGALLCRDRRSNLLLSKDRQSKAEHALHTHVRHCPVLQCPVLQFQRPRDFVSSLQDVIQDRDNID